MIDMPGLNRGPAAVRSPADRILGPCPASLPPGVYATGHAAEPCSLSRRASLSHRTQVAEIQGLQGASARLHPVGIGSDGSPRLRSYADPHILLSNSSWTASSYVRSRRW